MARTSQTQKNKAIFLEALEKSLGNITLASQMTGISRRTFYNWLRDDEEFKQAVDDITEIQIDFVESKLLERIKQGDTTAIIFYLKTRAKHRGYVERMEIKSDKVDAVHIEIINPELKKKAS